MVGCGGYVVVCGGYVLCKMKIMLTPSSSTKAGVGLSLAITPVYIKLLLPNAANYTCISTYCGRDYIQDNQT